MNTFWLWCGLLFWALAIIPAGSFLATDHWHKWKTLRWLPHWLGTVLGFLTIGAGALACTHYWNELSIVEQRRGMVKAVAAEITYNMGILRGWTKVDDDDPGRNTIRVYHRLKTETLNAALSSGLFVDQEDRMLLSMMAGLSERFSTVNDRLPIGFLKMLESPINVEVVRRSIESKELIDPLVIRIRKMLGFLIDCYGLDPATEPYIGEVWDMVPLPEPPTVDQD